MRSIQEEIRTPALLPASSLKFFRHWATEEEHVKAIEVHNPRRLSFLYGTSAELPTSATSNEQSSRLSQHAMMRHFNSNGILLPRVGRGSLIEEGEEDMLAAINA